MKTIRDHLTGYDVSIELIGNAAVMYANGNRIETPIARADISLARVALTKGWLDGFGSFFERSKAA